MMQVRRSDARFPGLISFSFIQIVLIKETTVTIRAQFRSMVNLREQVSLEEMLVMISSLGARVSELAAQVAFLEELEATIHDSAGLQLQTAEAELPPLSAEVALIQDELASLQSICQGLEDSRLTTYLKEMHLC